jgi:predicted RNA binding protein YcfA (HicA-like mRNA interferase family)
MHNNLGSWFLQSYFSRVQFKAIALSSEKQAGLSLLFSWEIRVPRKIRELISDLEKAGFVSRGGKGSHRNFTHPHVANPVTISGKLGDDAKNYQERIVKYAVEESQK